MYESIKSFNKQFLWEPEIVNGEKLSGKKSFAVVGMGGSALSPMLIKTRQPECDITIKKDYGLPDYPLEELKNKLIILSSYSGNTEEEIEAFHEARKKNLEFAVISTGGKLLSLAEEAGTSYVKMPNDGIQPRMAQGYSLRGFLKLMAEEEALKETSKLALDLDPLAYEEKGKKMAEKIRGHVPVIYSSARNLSIVYNWKIKLNETGKIPAFCNVFPEVNHNEMNGLDVHDATRNLSENFYFIILKDKNDHPQIQKRMEVLEKLYKDRGLKVETIELEGKNIWHKIFSSIILADWTAYYTATGYGLEAEQVPMVEEFKKLIA